jgi:uncharacterized protein (DUF58 family)
MAQVKADPGRSRGALAALLDRWLKRRTRLDLPITLGYRQIFILPTRFGWMLGLLMGAMLVGSLNFNNNLGLLTTFIVAAVAVNSMLLAYRNLHGLSIRRGNAAPVHAGRPLCYRLSLTQDDNRPRPGLVVRTGPRLARLDLPAASASEARLNLPTHHRGWQAVGRLRVETTHPLGLFRAWSWIEPSAPCLVWPQPAERAPPLPEHGTPRQGSQARQRDEGEEFHSLRQWREGDPLHRIAWKATQRHQTLLSREFREERSREIFLDLQRTPGRDLEERIRIVTAWILRAHAEGRSWSLKLGTKTLGPAGDPSHLRECLRALAEW